MGQNGQANMGDLPKRVAIVYDWVVKWGGAERVLLTLHEMFPDAPLYTSVYEPRSAGWAKVFPKIYAPKVVLNHKLFAWLLPIIFESYSFDDYDLVISVTSFAAKGIITKPGTRHICYCLTPTRFLWSHVDHYKTNLLGPVFNYLKYWDKQASSRPDKLIAISKTVQDRIKNYYHKDSEIIYPPVDTDYFVPSENPRVDYFLLVGRMESYKNSKKIIEIFNQTNERLIVVGSGSQNLILKTLAGKNILFVGQATDEKLREYYQHCKAVIFWHEEDFGIVPVEAMSCGKPVIGLNIGGVSETVINNKTGILISDESQELINAIKNFDSRKFDPKVIRDRALEYSKANFIGKLIKLCNIVI
ncbi:MAG: glycosyltransferase [Candidatus Amesbacteria bacterium]|nr:glycosyltransferase [Candidatus Amesbacteria bacterium]